MTPLSLADLDRLPRWVGWRIEERKGRPTKVPYVAATGQRAQSDAPTTWGNKQGAQQWAFRNASGSAGGIGIVLGDLGDGRALAGLDLDTCRCASGNFTPWANAVLHRFRTYAEVSPSHSGAKAFFLYDPAELATLRATMGTWWGKMWKQPGGGDHPPGIELYLGNRYFAFTAEQLSTAPATIEPVPLETLRWLITEAGPAISGKTTAQRQKAAPRPQEAAGASPDLIARIEAAAAGNPGLARRWRGDWAGLKDGSRSGMAFALGAALQRAGFTEAEASVALEHHADTRAWAAENGARGVQRIFENSQKNQQAIVTPWGEPDMTVLGSGRRTPPSLPLSLFGDRWASWITGAAEAAACPVDYVAMPLLATASALIGNARWPSAGEGWTEPPHLWTCVVGDSGSSKSPGADCLFRDVLPEIEGRMQGDHPERLQAWRAASESAKAREEQWCKDVKEANKSGHPPPMPPESTVGPAPEAPRLRQNDVTIEKVATLLALAAPKGLLVCRDELAGWLLGMNTYSDAARPFWLEAYGGRPYRVERQKHPEPINVPRNAVAVFGGTQPEKVAELFEDADDGLLSRLLWSWPDPIRFRLGRTRPAVATAIEALDRLRCLTMEPTKESRDAVPIYVPLRPDLLTTLERFGQDMQNRQAEAAGLMRSAFGKARGTVLRLSLVIELLRWCIEPAGHQPPGEIGDAALTAACNLVADYFMPMAERVYGDAAARPAARGAATLARWIAREKPAEVHVRTLQRETRLPGLKDAAAIHDAARVLVDADWLRPPERGTFQSRGSAVYTVNPALRTAG